MAYAVKFQANERPYLKTKIGKPGDHHLELPKLSHRTHRCAYVCLYVNVSVDANTHMHIHISTHMYVPTNVVSESSALSPLT